VRDSQGGGVGWVVVVGEEQVGAATAAAWACALAVLGLASTCSHGTMLLYAALQMAPEEQPAHALVVLTCTPLYTMRYCY
jgi:hypothetical protein